MNALSQPGWVHLYGRSQVWVLICVVSADERANVFPQSLKGQTKDRLGDATRTCDVVSPMEQMRCSAKTILMN